MIPQEPERIDTEGNRIASELYSRQGFLIVGGNIPHRQGDRIDDLIVAGTIDKSRVQPVVVAEATHEDLLRQHALIEQIIGRQLAHTTRPTYCYRVESD